MKKEKQSPFLSSSSHSTDEIFSASPFSSSLWLEGWWKECVCMPRTGTVRACMCVYFELEG